MAYRDSRSIPVDRVLIWNHSSGMRWQCEGAFNEIIQNNKKASEDVRIGVGISPDKSRAKAPGILAQWQFEFIRLQKILESTAKSWSICVRV